MSKPRPTHSAPAGRSPRRGRARRAILRYGWLLPLGAIFIGIGVLVVTYAFASIPLPADVPLDSSAEVYDRHGQLIGTFSGEERRFQIDTRRLPRYVGQAVISAEDRDFYHHNGISLKAIARAAWANLTGGEIVQGGSTITQQYVKNAVLRDPSQTVTRKLKEAVLAVKLERRYTKRQILGFYLNTIYLGRGAYGIEAAARTYFGEHARDLSLGEAAFLAGIIPSPESYQPDENRLGAKERRNRVLQIMTREGYISRRRARLASRGPVRLAPSAFADETEQPAAYFMEWIRRNYLQPTYGADLYTQGLKIYTTLDLRWQRDAEEAIANHLTEPRDPQAALVSMTPSGEVRALVGGRAFHRVRAARGFNYATDLPGREPGSSAKPYTLLSAVKEGISPQSRFPGPPEITIDDPACAYPDGRPWEPANYAGASYGFITLDQATTFSVNTVFAQLVAEVGPERVAETLERFGFRGPDGTRRVAANCSLALGSGIDFTPLQSARAYAGLTARGMLPEVMPIRYVTDRRGHCIEGFRRPKGIRCDEESRAAPTRVTDQNSADVVNEVLTHVVEGGTATAANIGRPVAGKTGTAQEYKDAWFAGSVPQLTTVVWMGYPLEPGPDHKFGTTGDNFTPVMSYCGDPQRCRPVHGINVSGGSFPAQIWADYMEDAVANLPVETFPEPEDIPNEVINPVPPPQPEPEPAPAPAPEPEPAPSPTQEPSPSPRPTPQPEPSPTREPAPIPKPTPTDGIPPSPSPGPGPPGQDGGDPGNSTGTALGVLVLALTPAALRSAARRRRR